MIAVYSYHSCHCLVPLSISHLHRTSPPPRPLSFPSSSFAYGTLAALSVPPPRHLASPITFFTLPTFGVQYKDSPPQIPDGRTKKRPFTWFPTPGRSSTTQPKNQRSCLGPSRKLVRWQMEPQQLTKKIYLDPLQLLVGSALVRYSRRPCSPRHLQRMSPREPNAYYIHSCRVLVRAKVANLP